MSSLIGTSLSGLMAAQSALNATSNNIANANTVGYNTESVNLSTAPAIASNGGYVGQGVNTATVTRSYNQFATQQVTSTTSAYAQANTLSTLAFGVDQTLSDKTTGLSGVLSNFSSATTGVANDPTSLSARQALLSAAGSVTQQINSLSSQLNTLNTQTNGQVLASVSNINAYATSIAALNTQIVAATNSSTNGQAPNTLLDQRDELVAKIAQQANVSTITQANGSINVMIGSGQTLVSGSNVAQLSVGAASTNPSNSTVLLNGQDISQQITGGTLAGTLNFQTQVLNTSQQQLGLVAVGFAQQMNTQQAAGYDLNGNAGTAMFNLGTPTVIANATNTGSITTTYDATTLGQLQASDYQLSNNAGTYTLTQLSNGVVTNPTANAGVITGPGFDINVSTIGSGDSYLIRPTFNAAQNMSTVMTDPTLVAAAATNGYSKAANVFQINGVNIGAVTGGTSSATQATAVAAAINTAITAYNLTSAGIASPATIIASGIGGSVTITNTGSSINPITITGDISDTGLSTGTTPLAGTLFSAVGGAVLGISPALTVNLGDNSNVLAMAKLGNNPALLGGTVSFNGAYTQLITNVGNVTQSASLNSTAQQAALAQATATQQNLSGVNLDEEAANLIKYQQAYQASSKAISVAQSLFTTLIGALQ
ncbi:MAG: flagellar hook-associated protein FlgK [Methylococcales bacterium]|nr:flagellar hook-associated protein FlgK [Methylococcales bacterium]